MSSLQRLLHRHLTAHRTTNGGNGGAAAASWPPTIYLPAGWGSGAELSKTAWNVGTRPAGEAHGASL